MKIRPEVIFLNPKWPPKVILGRNFNKNRSVLICDGGNTIDSGFQAIHNYFF